MPVTREDVELLLRLDAVRLPSVAAKRWVFSNQAADVAATGTFFEDYGLDSDERFHINEVATCYELVGLLWREGVVDREIVLEWTAAAAYWNRLGPILEQAREIFDAPQLWAHFEALATEQQHM